MNVDNINSAQSALSFPEKVEAFFSDKPISKCIVKGSMLGALHGAAITFAVYKGLKIATAPISIPAYMLMHVVKTAVTNCFETGFKWGDDLFKQPQEGDTGILRQFTWKVARGGNSVIKKVDSVYSWTFGIHTAEQVRELKLQDTHLYTTEIIRKLFWQHVKEQFINISSWEIGRMVGQTLLKCTILTFVPGTFKVYTFTFFGTLGLKVYEARQAAELEQHKHLEEILQNQINPLTDNIHEYFQALEGYCKEEIYREAGVEFPAEYKRELLTLHLERHGFDVATFEEAELDELMLEDCSEEEYSFERELLVSYLKMRGFEGTEFEEAELNELLESLNREEFFNFMQEKLEGFQRQVFQIEENMQCYYTDTVKTVARQLNGFIARCEKNLNLLKNEARQASHLIED